MKNLLIALLFLSLGLNGQNTEKKALIKPCVSSNFSKNAVDCDTYSFTATSTSSSGTTIIGYFWDFGDGSTSISQNPSHSYSSNGTYTVTLTTIGVTSSGDCCCDKLTMQVVVNCSSNSCGTIVNFRDVNQLCSKFVTYYIPINGLILNSGWTATSYDWTFVANNGYTVTATGVQPTVNLSDYFCNCAWSTTLQVTATNAQGETCILTKTIDLFSGGSDLSAGCNGNRTGNRATNPTINISPNPVSEFLNVHLENAEDAGNSKIQLNFLDVNGKSYNKVDLSAGKSDYLVDVSNLAKGIYILQVTIDEVIIQTEKVMVH